MAVTSENARYLVKYLSDVEQQNHDVTPETPSVGRLGWIDDFGFSPFMDGLVFDGLEDYRSRFESIHPKGSRDVWMDCVLQARKGRTKGNAVFRIVLAASFASVLVKPTRCQPFFVHLWGGSETGKTFGMLVAASVWADPELGKYVQSFNSTEVSKELGAAFYNSLPLMLDEFQIVDSGKQQDFDALIYQLSEGMGHGRGKKTGGVQKTTTWSNCIISTGENPIITPKSKTGAMNRTVEICCEDMNLFDDPRAINAVYDNFGFVGREFVEKLMEPGNIEKALAVWERERAEIKTDNTMDKQTNSAALILAADALAEEWIFQDGIRLKPSDITPYMVSKEMMSQNQRALGYIHDIIAMNPAKFAPEQENYNGEIWGKMGGAGPGAGYVYIIKSKFDQLLNDNGFNASSFLGWARRCGEIETDAHGKNTVMARINKTSRRCVKLRLPGEGFEDLECEQEELPF